MRKILIVAISVLLISTSLRAQDKIPAGTILPLQLDSSVKSKKAKPGQRISARIMQDVPLPGGERLRAGAKVVGEVVSIRPAAANHNAEITFRFDNVIAGHHSIRVITNLRALASMMEVAQAQVPEMGADRGTPSYWWTTDQIGGQVNYHGHGLLTEGSEVVGHSIDDGVLARVSANSHFHCRDGILGNDQLQALWVFSSHACGLYGYGDVLLKHAGRTDPKGEITLDAKRGDVNLRAGSGMLLRVN
jgi:hypothetical protein